MPRGVYTRTAKHRQICKQNASKSRPYLRNGGYHAIHKWLIKYYGNPSVCQSKNCEHKSKRFQWCLKRSKRHEYKRENYLRLCQCCHRRYDDNPSWRHASGNAHRGKKLSNAHKEKISKSMKEYRNGIRKTSCIA